MEDCLFCKIASKSIPSYILYEDNDIIAVLDIFPVNIGSTFIFPKVHATEFEYLSDEIIYKMFYVAKYISIILKEVLKYDHINLIINIRDSTLAKTEHTYIYLLPRFKDDSENIKFFLRKNRVDSQTLEEMKNIIIKKLGEFAERNLKKEKENKNENLSKKDFESMYKWFIKRI